jgi:lipoprotein-anchoring transpeptidase ErfK/SrfK
VAGGSPTGPGAPGGGGGGVRGRLSTYRWRVGIFAALVVVAVAVALAVLATARGSLNLSATALASVSSPLGGGKLANVTVFGPHRRRIPVRLEGQRIWPRRLIPVGTHVTVEAVIRRPGWLAWLTGKSERVSLRLVTPSARLRTHYLTIAPGAPLPLRFDSAVATISEGPAGRLRRRVLQAPQRQVDLPRSALAGSTFISATPRSWEVASSSAISWFPPGATAAAVANPAPGSQIQPATPISLTFSEPVDRVLGDRDPVLSPATPGAWRAMGTHTLTFEPTGIGYGLDTDVTVALPAGVQLVGAHATSDADTASWTVPRGSTLRLQELLAQLGYLPFRVTGSAARVALTAQAQEAAAVDPPSGGLRWRYGDVPSALRGFWQPGVYGELTKGAVMSFENQHEMTADGVAGAAVWRALLADAVAHRDYSFGYTFVDVSEESETLDLWHDGRTVMTTPVNTGIAGAPTAKGTFAVYEHIPSGTMTGTNPDGTKYHDPGIPWISYFNGGDALHGFIRASYGFPQSLGCVEMAPATAGRVYPYTPIGTIVNIH